MKTQPVWSHAFAVCRCVLIETFPATRPQNLTTPQKGVTPASPPYSNKDSEDAGSEQHPPPEYRQREAVWFKPGRYFKIWAPRDEVIHEKEFVLLDSKNIYGPGLLVRHYDDVAQQNDNKGSHLRNHVLIENWSGQSKAAHKLTKVVNLEEYYDEEGEEVDKNTWIELDHVCNIPFPQYWCVDRGMLERSSLKKLRRHYVEWLAYEWDVEPDTS